MLPRGYVDAPAVKYVPLRVEFLAHVEGAAQPHSGLAGYLGRTIGRRGRPGPGEQLLDGERGLFIGGGDLDDGQARLRQVRFR
jgi:hypothetical protein